jgi:hypothetical protein
VGRMIARLDTEILEPGRRRQADRGSGGGGRHRWF